MKTKVKKGSIPDPKTKMVRKWQFLNYHKILERLLKGKHLYESGKENALKTI